MKVVFVIPAYNEEQNLPRLFANLHSTMEAIPYPYEIVLVNDGSTDGTRRLVEAQARTQNKPIHLVNHEVNLGPGAVFRSGLTRALEVAEEYDVVMTKEADNTGDYQLIKPMIEKIRSGYELVLASCYGAGGGVEGTTWDRQLLSWGANLMLRILFPMPGVHTYSSFYRAYHAGTLRRAMTLYGDRFIEEPGFACMVEILINFYRMGVKMVELPMVLRCDEREDASKMKRLRTTAGFLRVMVRKGLVQRRAPGEGR